MTFSFATHSTQSQPYVHCDNAFKAIVYYKYENEKKKIQQQIFVYDDSCILSVQSESDWINDSIGFLTILSSTMKKCSREPFDSLSIEY